MTTFPGKHWGPNWAKNRRKAERKAARQAEITSAKAIDGVVYSQDAACAEAIDWLQMEGLIFKSEGKFGNAKMADNVIALIRQLQGECFSLAAGVCEHRGGEAPANTVPPAPEATANGDRQKPENDDYTAADKLRECNFNARLRGDFWLPAREE